MEEKTKKPIDLWVHKYSPQTLDEVVGSDKNVKEIIKWGNRYDKDNVPKQKKALLFVGNPGVGFQSLL